MSNCKHLWIAGKKHQHLQPAGKDLYLRKLDEVPQKENDRQMDRKREKGVSREDAVVYAKGGLRLI